MSGGFGVVKLFYDLGEASLTGTGLLAVRKTRKEIEFLQRTPTRPKSFSKTDASPLTVKESLDGNERD